MTRTLEIVFVLMLLPGLVWSAAPSSSLECQQLPSLFRVYLGLHYAAHALNDEVKANAVEQFIKAIDPGKTLLLESDVATMRTQLQSVFDSMLLGGCTGLDSAYQLVVRRVEEDEALARQLLGAKEFKLDESVALVVDAEARGRPRTPAERQELLRKLVHFQIANLLLTDVKIADATKELIHRYELVTRRFKERAQKDELPILFAESFASGLDPHTSFLSKEELENFQIQMRLSLEGIGASLSSQDGFTVIEELIPGGSADRLNLLRAKDKIIAVGQGDQKPVSVIDMDLRSVVKMIRGKKGTTVRLTILRQGTRTETFDVSCVRDKIDLKEAAAKLTYETRSNKGKSFKVAVIDLPTFYGGGKSEGRSSSGDVRRLLLEAKQNGAQGVVLDLARNGGGLLDEAVRIAGLFVRKGQIVATHSSNGQRRELEDEDSEVAWNGPLLVATSHASASASEILAGALKDYRRALVVGGDHTFGKGTVQVLSELPAKLGAIKVTTGMYFLPGGASTQRTGVKSDIEVPSVFNGRDVGEKKMEHALPAASIEPFLSEEVNGSDSASHWTPLDERTVRALAVRSRDRVNKDPEIAKTIKDLAEGQKKEAIKLSDMLKKVKKDDLKKSLTERIKNLEAPFLRECVNIMADWLALSGN